MTTLPRPSRPSNGPPSVALPALPALPVGKTRKSTGGLPAPATTPSKSGLRAPSAALTRSTSPGPTTTLPQPRSVSGFNAAGKTLRKTVSINSFPQPPRGDNRVASLPPSPLSNGLSSKSRTPTTPNYSLGGGTPSLLNGTGDGKAVARGSTRNSDGLISVASPPQSRSSSAQDSYSTSATQYDDVIDVAQQKLDANNRRSSKVDSGKGNVIVSVRIRPEANGHDDRAESEWAVDGRKSLVGYRGKEGGDYYYDNVFVANDDNSRVYDHIAKRLVRRVMEGYHGTVFAYGMTGTGKTFSMQGTASSPGVIPLAITDIFSYIRETPSREFLLRVSYLEIYNERIHDLLSMPTTNAVGVQGQEEIKLREDSKRGVYASPLKEEIVQSPTQLLRVIARGDQARRTASTQFNARSSRSHAVVQIVVESRERIPGNPTNESKRSGLPPGGVRVSTLSLIDLAGSEKAAETKERRTEGSHINKSLLTLGTVIAKLSEHKDKESKGADKDSNKHLPYRDSKLTRLLQGALSGGSLVSILCTIQTGASGSNAAANSHATETINTLKFASRAKNSIVSHAKRAEEALGSGGDGGARVLLERYRMEILELRKELDTQAKNGGGKSSTKKEESEGRDDEKSRDAKEELVREKEAEHRHEEQMLEMQLARTALKERIDHLNRLILSSKSTGVNVSGSFSSLGMHSRFSQSSMRSSILTTNGARPLMERTPSMTSTSTIGRVSCGRRNSSGGEQPAAGAADEDESLGEFGDGNASLAAQNRALQSDLTDKNRYIQTLEKRLLQARRASQSRTSVGLASGSKGIMVGEDHSVAALLKEKDAEIQELRARLDDKDRMLGALRSAARSRDNADRVESRAEVRSSLVLDQGNGNGNSASAGPASPSTTANASLARQMPSLRKRTKSVDEMSKMLDEMIQDRVESGQIVRGSRGSVRVAPNDRKRESSADPPIQLQLLTRQRSSPLSESSPVALGA